jgi:hypothetical protein
MKYIAQSSGKSASCYPVSWSGNMWPIITKLTDQGKKQSKIKSIKINFNNPNREAQRE